MQRAEGGICDRLGVELAMPAGDTEHANPGTRKPQLRVPQARAEVNTHEQIGTRNGKVDIDCQSHRWITPGSNS